jgi:hypothetical protein
LGAVRPGCEVVHAWSNGAWQHASAAGSRPRALSLSPIWQHESAGGAAATDRPGPVASGATPCTGGGGPFPDRAEPAARPSPRGAAPRAGQPQPQHAHPAFPVNPSPSRPHLKTTVRKTLCTAPDFVDRSLSVFTPGLSRQAGCA